MYGRMRLIELLLHAYFTKLVYHCLILDVNVCMQLWNECCYLAGEQ